MILLTILLFFVALSTSFSLRHLVTCLHNRRDSNSPWDRNGWIILRTIGIVLVFINLTFYNVVIKGISRIIKIIFYGMKNLKAKVSMIIIIVHLGLPHQLFP